MYNLYATKGVTLLNSSSPDFNLHAIHCRRCKKLLTDNYAVSPLCPDCIDKDKEDYRIVKEYIQSHANTNAYQVAQNTGISLKVIMRFIREDLVQTIDPNTNSKE
ncbi:hypothetical protein [Anaerosporobacter sp.]